MRKILVLGANSAIARACARRFVGAGHALFLVGRDPSKLAATLADLEVRRGGGPVHGRAADLTETAGHAALIAEARAALGGLDTVLVAHGELGVQAEAERSDAAARAIFETNLLSPVALLTRLANDFAAEGRGCLAVITSVAGDRGRGSNYVYGAAKGGLSIFLGGLRNRLAASGVSVVDLKLGIVETPMTAGRRKGLLWATPDQVARRIVLAVERGEDIVYAPWFWRWIMLVIRSVPERIFKRLRL